MQLQVVYFLILSIGIHSVSRCGVQAQEGAPQLGPDVVSINVDHSPLSSLDKVAASVNESRQEEVQTTTDNDEKNSQDTPDTRKNLIVYLAVVVCGNRMEEALTMLKSAAIFTFTKVHFYVFAEDHLHAPILERLKQMSDAVKETISYDVLPIQFPKGNEDMWKTLFKPCACQRLFLPDLLVDTDALIYLDTDILFMRPPEDLWNFFNEFNSTQLAGVSPEGEDAPTGWYNKHARHPYYGELGINSGIMLMNLTRMRKANWNDIVLKKYQDYRSGIVFGDQDILNVVFHFYPEMLYTFTCDWNYRPDHCRYGRNDCKHADKNGISLLHGNRQIFHKDDFPPFRMVYDVIEGYNFVSGVPYGIYDPLMKYLPTARKSGYCNNMWKAMIKIIKKYLKQYKQQFRRRSVNTEQNSF